MARLRRVAAPPPTGNPSLDRWLQQVTDALSAIPRVSVISTANGPNDSGVTADVGTLGIDVGSVSSKLWFNDSGDTNGWSYVSYI